MTARHVAVVDIGKTNAKLALVDLSNHTEIAVVTRPNAVVSKPPWPHFDVEGHWNFLLNSLASFQASYGIDAITITTHGAAGALIGFDGNLAAPVLDYEHQGPEAVRQEYAQVRPDFAETGSPLLAGGLNLGAQIHWQFLSDQSLQDRVKHIVTYPQYWGFRLTGVAATDPTSLGCHTDLWNPKTNSFSSLVQTLDIENQIAPCRPCGDILGPVKPEICERTGISADTPVYCGIHDSNASLLPHLLREAAPITVVSTGTWIISMAIGGRPVTLDPDLDTLINVNAFGNPVPSSRFMGGREHDMLTGGTYHAASDHDISAVLASGEMILPGFVSNTGPFPNQQGRWVGEEPDFGTGRREVCVGFYLALVTERCLDLIGHKGTIVVEGPFAQNWCFNMMLSSVTGCDVRLFKSQTGTSLGAALLAVGDPQMVPDAGQRVEVNPKLLPELNAYAQLWRNRLPA